MPTKWDEMASNFMISVCVCVCVYISHFMHTTNIFIKFICCCYQNYIWCVRWACRGKQQKSYIRKAYFFAHHNEMQSTEVKSQSLISIGRKITAYLVKCPWRWWMISIKFKFKQFSKISTNFQYLLTWKTYKKILSDQI